MFLITFNVLFSSVHALLQYSKLLIALGSVIRVRENPVGHSRSALAQSLSGAALEKAENVKKPPHP
jgi:hypothetical protein